jgi:hypothetical protein
MTAASKRPTRKDVNAAVRATNALTMRKLGYTYDKIAEQCGYRERGAAYHAVQRELQRTIAPVAEDVRELELARLDDLLTVYFSKAMKGDGWSMDRVLRIMERRAAFLGLDEKKDDAAHSARIVLLSIAQDVIEAI